MEKKLLLKINEKRFPKVCLPSKECNRKGSTALVICCANNAEARVNKPELYCRGPPTHFRPVATQAVNMLITTKWKNA